MDHKKYLPKELVSRPLPAVDEARKRNPYSDVFPTPRIDLDDVQRLDESSDISIDLGLGSHVSHLSHLTILENQKLEYFLTLFDDPIAQDTSGKELEELRNIPPEEWPQFIALDALLADNGPDNKLSRDFGSSSSLKSNGKYFDDDDMYEDEDSLPSNGALGAAVAAGGGSVTTGLHRLKKKHQYPRTKYAELERKLRLLKTDPTVRAELEERIHKYKELRANQQINTKKFVTCNKEKISSFSPEQIREEALKKLERSKELRIKVAEKRRALLEEDHLYKLEIAQRAQAKLEAEARNQKQLLLQRREDSKQKKWLQILTFASTLGTVVETIHRERERREIDRLHNDAACRIQKWWRHHTLRIQGAIWKHRMIVVHRVLRRHIIRFRVRRKNAAADILRQFLGDIQDVARVTKVIKRFRFCVSLSQSFWRRYYEIIEAQQQFCLLQWNRVERELEEETRQKWEKRQAKKRLINDPLNHYPRRRAFTGETGYIPPMLQSSGLHVPDNFKTSIELEPVSPRGLNPHQTPSKSPQQSNDSKSILSMLKVVDPFESIFPKISEKVKMDIISHQLQKRRLVYANTLAEYYRQKAKWTILCKEREEIELARTRLHSAHSQHFSRESSRANSCTNSCANSTMQSPIVTPRTGTRPGSAIVNKNGPEILPIAESASSEPQHSGLDQDNPFGTSLLGSITQVAVSANPSREANDEASESDYALTDHEHDLMEIPYPERPFLNVIFNREELVNMINNAIAIMEEIKEQERRKEEDFISSSEDEDETFPSTYTIKVDAN